MKQTLTSFTISPATPWGSAPKVRLYADDQFRASTGELHPAGNETANYAEIPLTPSGVGFTWPPTEIDTTDDSSNPSATYTAKVFNGTKEVYVLFERWEFRASHGAIVSWGDLEAANVQRVARRDDQTYTTTGTDLRIASQLNVGNPMTTVALGRGYVDTTPADPAVPRLVGVNSPLLGFRGSMLRAAMLALTSPVLGWVVNLTDSLRGLWRYTTGNQWIKAEPQVRVEDFGARADGKHHTDGVSNGTTTFTSAAATFTSADVGKTFVADCGAGSGCVATATRVGETVGSIAVSNGGSGYLVAPEVRIEGGGGHNATATATIAGGVVTGITVNNAGVEYEFCDPAVVIGRPVHTTTIQQVLSANTVVLASAPPRSATGVWFAYGTENTAAIQAAMDASGGGAVFCDKGNYLFTGSLNIPAGVTLQGTWSGPPIYDGYWIPGLPIPSDGRGTTFMPSANAGKLFGGSSVPFVSFGTGTTGSGNHAALRGINIFYPTQTRDGAPPNLFPPSVLIGHYSQTASNEYVAMNALVENVSFHNPYWAIFSRQTARQWVRNIHGDPLAVGVYADRGFDVSQWENIHWTQDAAGISGPLFNWKYKYSTGFVFGKVDEHRIHNCFTIFNGTGFKFYDASGAGGPWATISSCGSDLAGVGVDILQTSVQTGGLSFSGTSSTGHSTANGYAASYGFYTRASFSGVVTWTGGRFTGTPTFAVLVGGSGGSVAMTAANIAGWVTRAMWISPTSAVTVDITGNLFTGTGGVGILAESLVRGVIGGNAFPNHTIAAALTNNSTQQLLVRNNVASNGMLPDTYGANSPQINRLNADQLLVEPATAGAVNVEFFAYSPGGGTPVVGVANASRSYAWSISPADNALYLIERFANLVRLKLSPAGVFTFTEGLEVDKSVVPNDTRLLVWDVTAGTLRRVSIGAADSGGVGYRVLRIIN